MIRSSQRWWLNWEIFVDVGGFSPRYCFCEVMWVRYFVAAVTKQISHWGILGAAILAVFKNLGCAEPGSLGFEYRKSFVYPGCGRQLCSLSALICCNVAVGSMFAARGMFPGRKSCMEAACRARQIQCFLTQMQLIRDGGWGRLTATPRQYLLFVQYIRSADPNAE